MDLKYPSRPILGLKGLARCLSVPPTSLLDIAARADGLYRPAKLIVKPDGSTRQPYDALPALKLLHRRIQVQILSRVQFPEYLTGSIKGRDATKNAQLHLKARIVISEDIADFFPSTSSELVKSIWSGFFGFGDEAAGLLTALTTKDGALPQGAITSSYLANLAFWRREGALHARCAERGIRYSRYVDDISLSSVQPLTKVDITWCVSQVYGMMRSGGYFAKRRKHDIARANGPMSVTKLLVNQHPALSTSTRGGIRVLVHKLAKAIESGAKVSEAEINSARGKIARVRSLHPTQGANLRRKLTSALDK